MATEEKGAPPKIVRKKVRVVGLGARIKAGLAQRGLSNVEVAVELGVDDSTVTNWTKDRREPAASQILALSRLTGLSVEELLGVETDKARLWRAARIWLEATHAIEQLALDMAKARAMLEDQPPPFPEPAPLEEPEMAGAGR